MNYKTSLDELRNESVPANAVEHAIRAAAIGRAQKPNHRLRRGLVLAGAMTVVAAFGIYPWRNTDKIWAQAKATLDNAPLIHIKLDRPLQIAPTEVWIKGEKVVEKVDKYETRFNGTLLTKKLGQVSSVTKANHQQGIFMRGYVSFETIRHEIDKGTAKQGRQTRNGKSYITYEVVSGTIGFSSNQSDKYSHVADNVFTAFVDEKEGKIVRLEQVARPNLNLDEYNRTHKNSSANRVLQQDSFVAVVDYPDTIDDSIFEPPADTFDEQKSKEVVATLLSKPFAEATVAGQTVKLHGILFDGNVANVVWSGVPSEFGSSTRFSISGVTLGKIQDQRCLSAGKVTNPKSATSPFCQQGTEVTSTMPKTVDLVLPIFAPDRTKPYGNRGFHSKQVGTYTFHNVPVTPTMWLGAYERQLGLLGAWW